MSCKDSLHRGAGVTALTSGACLARDLAEWLEDREAAAVQDRDLARARLEHRYAIPRGVFWAARYRVRESIGRWLDRLVQARVAEMRRDIHELETTMAAARALGRDDLGPEIEEAQAAVSDAKALLVALLAQTKAEAGAR